MSDFDDLQSRVHELERQLRDEERRHRHEQNLWEVRLRYAARGLEVTNRDLAIANSRMAAQNKELSELRQHLEDQNQELQRAMGEVERAHRVLEAELEAAVRIQAQLMPAAPILSGGVEIYGAMTPASRLGGDFFNYQALVHDGRELIAVCVGDVTGHGASSAMLSAVVKAALDAQLKVDPSPPLVLRYLNETILAACGGSKFMTCFFALIDVARQQIVYANAAHNFPILYSAGVARTLGRSGSVLGLALDASFQQVATPFTDGDVVILYTDGVTEAANGAGRQLGTKALRSCFLAHVHEPAPDVVRCVVDASLAHAGRSSPEDDMTVVVIKAGILALQAGPSGNAHAR